MLSRRSIFRSFFVITRGHNWDLMLITRFRFEKNSVLALKCSSSRLARINYFYFFITSTSFHMLLMQWPIVVSLTKTCTRLARKKLGLLLWSWITYTLMWYIKSSYWPFMGFLRSIDSWLPWRISIRIRLLWTPFSPWPVTWGLHLLIEYKRKYVVRWFYLLCYLIMKKLKFKIGVKYKYMITILV